LINFNQHLKNLVSKCFLFTGKKEVKMPEAVVDKPPATLGGLFGKDLAGWQITLGYFLELQHGLMGRFPAILDDSAGDGDGAIVFVIDKRLLRHVWDHVPRSRAKITTLLVVANPDLGVAYFLGRDFRPEQTEPFKLFSASDITKLCEKRSPFRWAPGLLGARDSNAFPPDFS
jgi:hypothetical protein